MIATLLAVMMVTQNRPDPPASGQPPLLPLRRQAHRARHLGRTLRSGAEPGLRRRAVPRRARRRGFNLTRTFSGTYREIPGSFKIPANTLAPAPGPLPGSVGQGGREVQPRPPRPRLLRAPQERALRGRRTGDRRRICALLPVLRRQPLGREPDEREEQRERRGPVPSRRGLHPQTSRPPQATGRLCRTRGQGAERVRQPLLRDLQRALLRGRHPRLARRDRPRDRGDRKISAQETPDRAKHCQRQGEGRAPRPGACRSSTSTMRRLRKPWR